MNEGHELMEAVCREFPDKKAPHKLVEKFLKSLQEKEVMVERTTNLAAKYFVGRKKNAVAILAHESTKTDWWGVKKQIIDRIINKKILWGIALLDGGCRGFWIPGENFLELTKLKIVTLGKTNQYHFNKSTFEKSDLVIGFFTVTKFIKISGLE
jgi:hypothetical protein